MESEMPAYITEEGILDGTNIYEMRHVKVYDTMVDFLNGLEGGVRLMADDIEQIVGKKFHAGQQIYHYDDMASYPFAGRSIVYFVENGQIVDQELVAMS